MAKIEVGCTITKYKDGKAISVVKKPSCLIKEDGSKVELSDEEAKKYGIGVDENE